MPALRYDALAFIDGDLAMLTAKPQSWLNWDFTLARNGEFLANIDLSIWRERGGLLSLIPPIVRIGKGSFLGHSFWRPMEL